MVLIAMYRRVDCTMAGQSLKEFLTGLGEAFPAYLPALTDAGATAVSDLLDVAPVDRERMLKEVGIKPFHIVKINKALSAFDKPPVYAAPPDQKSAPIAHGMLALSLSSNGLRCVQIPRSIVYVPSLKPSNEHSSKRHVPLLLYPLHLFSQPETKSPAPVFSAPTPGATPKSLFIIEAKDVAGLAVSPDNKLWAACRTSVRVFDLEGKFLFNAAEGHLESAAAVAFDSTGDAFVIDRSPQLIIVCRADGSFVRQFSIKAMNCYASTLALDGHGFVYTAGAFDNYSAYYSTSERKAGWRSGVFKRDGTEVRFAELLVTECGKRDEVAYAGPCFFDGEIVQFNKKTLEVRSFLFSLVVFFS